MMCLEVVNLSDWGEGWGERAWGRGIVSIRGDGESGANSNLQTGTYKLHFEMKGFHRMPLR